MIDLADHMPTLTTDRLTLRAPRPADFDAYANFAASDRATGVGGPHPRWQAWRSFAQLWGHFALRGYTRFTVTRTGADDEPLGLIGPYHPVEWPEAELAWSVYAPAEGQGIAFEAAIAVRRHVYDDLGWPTAISVCEADNPRTVALAKRLGCTPDGTFDHPGYGTMPIWRHPAPAEVAA
ncbi:GNAT family N-acetyltransferase [Jannaschia sp. LMIT008]|uniref:GNAT family N-acetyltransferase n=1 Tax=Jannaschia maritima TaxID=3032585 RepID=UPI0028118CC0|nr:GNAT family N-acetyltransferase [Jannaschia sp. LMIT008]